MNQFPVRSYNHLLIRASAGTGKTYRLSSRFIELLRDGVPCERILATTFTRKAAGEIMDRVILRLAEAAQDDGQRRALAGGAGGGTISRADCLKLLQQVMRSLHRLRISTLDSFFGQVARGFSLELGLPAGWQIVDEVEDARLRSAAIAETLAAAEVNRLRTLINLLTKGAAARSVSQLIYETVSNAYELFQETDSEAWKQVPRYKPLDEAELAATAEALRTLALTAKRLAAARDGDYDRAMAGDWEDFLNKGLAAKLFDGETTYYSTTIPDDAVAVYQRLIDHAKAELVGRVAMQTEATHDLLVRFHGEYDRLKRTRRAMRFGDVTRRLGDLREVADEKALAFRLDSHIDHLLLDEFQDTAPQQWRVLRPMAERTVAGRTARSFFCVGDVKQAIYGWRGGVAEIFDAIDQQLTGLTGLGLNTSYRSSPAVIDTVNRVFAGIDAHPNLGRAANAVQRWSDRFEPHATAKTQLPGYAELVTAPLAADDGAPRETTLDFAARKIAGLVNLAPGFGIGVLVRKNDTVARLIYLLRKLGVRASEEGGNPLTDSAAVQIVLSLLRLTDHPGDTVARFHVAHSPLAPHVQLTDHADDEQARRVARMVRAVLVGDGYGPTIYRWAAALAPHCNRRELSRLEQLVERAYAYAGRETLRTAGFVEIVTTQRVADAMPASVRVMTVHQAKGLEFDIVVLPELDVDLVGQPPAFVAHHPDVTQPADRLCRYAAERIQRMLPESWQRMFSDATDAAVSEALCVLYVALTRAAHALHVVISPSKPNEKSLPRTYAGLLRGALRDDQPTPPETVLYEYGDPHWFAAPTLAKKRTRREAPTVEPAASPIQVQLAPQSGPRCRGWGRARPSGLEGGATVRLGDVLVGQRSAALSRGRLVHAWFERVTWLDDGLPNEAALREVAERLATEAGAATPDVAAELASFQTALQQPAIAEMLSRSRYRDGRGLGFSAPVQQALAQQPLLLDVQNERTFAVRDDEQLLTGYVDRLVLLRHGPELVAAEIVDFKTDAVTAGQKKKLDDRVEFYSPQLNAYRRAVARLTHLAADRISAWLVFTEAGVVRRVDE